MNDIYQEYIGVFDKYQQAMKTAVLMLEDINSELESTYEYSLIHHIDSRIKTFDSLSEKLERKNLDKTPENMRQHIRDMAGIRIVCPFLADVYYLADKLVQQEGIEIIEVKDYIEYPKQNGYRSFHITVMMPVMVNGQTENIPVEIQLRTISMDAWAGLEHRVVYKSDDKKPAWFIEAFRRCAGFLSNLDIAIQAITGVEYQRVSAYNDLQLTTA